MAAQEITCKPQVNRLASENVAGGCNSKRRSGCPVSVSLELLGDRWSLLIVRDMMVRGYRTFKEFLTSGEGIATNILADRLRKLRAAGIVVEEVDPADGRKVNYRLTEKGIDLAPVLLDLLIWGAKHEPTGVPCEVIEKMAANREELLADVRRRWMERCPEPFLPSFRGGRVAGTPRHLKQKKSSGVDFAAPRSS